MASTAALGALVPPVIALRPLCRCVCALNNHGRSKFLLGHIRLRCLKKKEIKNMKQL